MIVSEKPLHLSKSAGYSQRDSSLVFCYPNPVFLFMDLKPEGGSL